MQEVSTIKSLPTSAFEDHHSKTVQYSCLEILPTYLSALRMGLLVERGSSCGEAGLLFVVVHGFLVAMASFVVKHRLQGLPWLTGKKSACNEGDVGLIPGSGRSS